jgi:hypothetical protein
MTDVNLAEKASAGYVVLGSMYESEVKRMKLNDNLKSK